MADRNKNTGFAARTMKNLDYVERAGAMVPRPDVHVVAQLVNSLTGLIVFPRARKGLESIGTQYLSDLAKAGWPQFNDFGLQYCTTLNSLIWRLRNAVAHGHIHFDSDSLRSEEVIIYIDDYVDDVEQNAVWSANIRADDLRSFCLKLAQHIEN